MVLSLLCWLRDAFWDDNRHTNRHCIEWRANVTIVLSDIEQNRSDLLIRYPDLRNLPTILMSCWKIQDYYRISKVFTVSWGSIFVARRCHYYGTDEYILAVFVSQMGFFNPLRPATKAIWSKNLLRYYCVPNVRATGILLNLRVTIIALIKCNDLHWQMH